MDNQSAGWMDSPAKGKKHLFTMEIIYMVCSNNGTQFQRRRRNDSNLRDDSIYSPQVDGYTTC